MKRVAHTREYSPDLLARRPWIDRSFAADPSPGVNPVDQLRELIDLYDRGLLSREDLERQWAKVNVSP
ncbi:SHOCT domain-containing protein [Nocardioides ungokensis]|uniref:SHOCT domain-containing protein n=1 Tax=Nocardioides ungokensis TaxID=1643322 RepID=UPI0015DFA746|nr:SHOCT domain-containing protein [Nocardioides ungokensis]